MSAVLDDIKNYVIQRLNREYGYCGVAEAPDMVFINSSDDDGDVTVQIKIAARESQS